MPPKELSKPIGGLTSSWNQGQPGLNDNKSSTPVPDSVPAPKPVAPSAPNKWTQPASTRARIAPAPATAVSSAGTAAPVETSAATAATPFVFATSPFARFSTPTASFGSGFAGASTPGSKQSTPLQESQETINPLKRSMDSETPRPKKRVKQTYTDAITVVVGSEAKEFTVHAGVISDKSTFFADACSAALGEDEPRKIKLPGQSVEYFRFYLDWVYNSKIDEDELQNVKVSYPPSPPGVRIPVPSETAFMIGTGEKVIFAASRISVLADFLGDVACKKACMELLMEYTTRLGLGGGSRIVNDTVQFIADNTRPDSGLFRWIVDDLASDATTVTRTAETMAKRMESFPTAVKDALLNKGYLALLEGKSIGGVGRDVSKYLD